MNLSFVSVTPTWLEEYDIDDSVMGKNLYSVLPHLNQSSKKQYQQALKGEERHIDKELFIDTQGNKKFFTHTISPIYQEDKIIGIKLSTRNITKETQQNIQNIELLKELQSCKDSYFATYIFQYTHDGVLITNAHNKIVAVNGALEQMSGYSLEELKDKNPKIFKSGWKKDKFYKEMWQILLEHDMWQGEVVNRHKNGNIFTVNLSIFVIRDPKRKIKNFISISSDITQTKDQEKKIEQLVYYDFLTKLPNKSLFREKVETHMKPKNQFAILMIDIYRFKLINQSIGYQEGDYMLYEFSKRLIQIVSKYDAIAARFEGDEFAIMMQYEDTLDISYLANEVMHLSKEPIKSNHLAVNIFSNIGIALYPQNSTSYDELMQYANHALHKSRERGKGRYGYYSDNMNQEARYRLEIDMNLYNAISNNEFYLVYQPKYSTKAQKTISCEVLIRWKNSQFGNLNPDQFIPIAEESEYIVAIGSWIVQQALCDLKEIQRIDPDFTMAINVSSKQLEDEDFINTLKHNIYNNGIDPSKVELEITETALMSDMDKAIKVLEEIKSLGVKLAIDDFGTGYSSMSYLKRLPIDTLKIDREFIKDLHNDHESQAIVNAIISLTKLFNLKSVAEGVEYIEDKEFLESIECDYLQGYYISRPLLLDDLLYFITQ